MFLVGILFTVASPALAKNKFEREVETEKLAVKLARETNIGGYGLVTEAELKDWLSSGKDMIIIDALPYKKSYKKGHIPGARNFLFPVAWMEKWDLAETSGKTKEDYVSTLGQNKNKTIVVYCGFVKCGRSHNGAAWAVKLGYKNVYRFAGGLYAWKGSHDALESVR